MRLTLGLIHLIRSPIAGSSMHPSYLLKSAQINLCNVFLRLATNIHCKMTTYCFIIYTVIPEIFALLIFARLIFAVIYYSRFHCYSRFRCSKNSLPLNFRVFNFRGFLRPRIINNRENFQNYGIIKFPFLNKADHQVH